MSIITPRLTVERLREDDRAYFLELQTDAKVRRFLGGPVEFSVAEKKFNHAVSCSDPEQHWTVRNPATGFIGLISFSEHCDGEAIEVSFQFLPAFWGNGFAHEALKATLKYAIDELGLPRIIAETQLSNSRSRKLLEKIPMYPLRNVERFGSDQIIYTT